MKWTLSVSPRSNLILMAGTWARSGAQFIEAPKQGEKMDTKPKDDKATELELEIAVFAAP
jgi:hypothetical protein